MAGRKRIWVRMVYTRGRQESHKRSVKEDLLRFYRVLTHFCRASDHDEEEKEAVRIKYFFKNFKNLKIILKILKK